MSTLGSAAHVRMKRFNHFAIKATCALRTITGSKRFNHFAIKATCALRTITGSSYCPQSASCFYSKVVKALCSHKNQFSHRGEPNDPGLGCATSARLPNMRPVAGSSYCPQSARTFFFSRLKLRQVKTSGNASLVLPGKQYWSPISNT
jgi:hypothetical protein